MDINTIFSLVILIFSAIIHEVSHGYAALFLGDPTAKLEGRLTLNPLKHLDPVGSVLVPIVTSLAGVAFGWAKPVPYNPYNLKNQKWGEAIVAFAGPLSNLSIAVLLGLFIRFFQSSDFISPSSLVLLEITVLINLMLAIFNLVPVPPLDGSKILFSFFPISWNHIRESMERYGMVLVLVLVFFLWKFISPLIFIVFSFLTGIQIGF